MFVDVNGQAPPGIRRVFFREILPGDRRKAVAQSNDAQTGGGARDFRFNAKGFDVLLKKMFTQEEVTRGRSIRTANVFWRQGNKNMHAKLEYWPPTNARPSEGRIAKISALAPFTDPPDTEEPVFALFSQHGDGNVWVRYATLSGIQAGNQTIAQHITACFGAKRGERAVIGYIDFQAGKVYCHE